MMRRMGSLLKMDQEELDSEPEINDVMRAGKEQIEYYLSFLNLDKDKFMRDELQKHEGYIPIEIFMNCNRIKQLGISSDDLLIASSRSPFLTVNFEQRSIAPKRPYRRDPSLKNRTARISGFSSEKLMTSDSVLRFLLDTKLINNGEVDNILLQYAINDAGHRFFMGAITVVFNSVDILDKLVKGSKQLTFDNKKLKIDRLAD